MLSKINRLTKEDGLEDVCKKGRSIKKGFLLIKYRNNNLPIIRMAIVVSKKTEPKANKRNLLKRRLRNAARKIIQFQSGKDIVLFVLSGAEKYSYNQLKEKLEECLSK
ncbi:MAG: ribonuclease P protein component [Candidatus Paceibacterota bacterium]|jgi:ribonuclease P protein component